MPDFLHDAPTQSNVTQTRLTSSVWLTAVIDEPAASFFGLPAKDELVLWLSLRRFSGRDGTASPLLPGGAAAEVERRADRGGRWGGRVAASVSVALLLLLCICCCGRVLLPLMMAMADRRLEARGWRGGGNGVSACGFRDSLSFFVRLSAGDFLAAICIFDMLVASGGEVNICTLELWWVMLWFWIRALM